MPVARSPSWLTRSVSHHMRALILLFVLGSCVGAPAGQSSTNQSEARLFISAVRGGRPIVSIEGGEFSSDRDFFKFQAGMTRQWQTNYGICSKALVESAKKEGLDAASLAKILQVLRGAPENKSLAVLPVAAHSTKSEGEQVWIVTFRWENAMWVSRLGANLAHIREFTVTQKTLKQIGFSACD